MQKADAQAASGGRIGARPCITYSGESRDDRPTIDDKPSVSVDNSRHQKDGRYRLAVEPMGLPRTCGDDAMECRRIAQGSHRLVLRRGIQGDRPGVIVPVQGKDRKQAHRRECTPRPARPLLPREIPRKISEVAIFGFFDRARGTRAGDPIAGRTSSSHGVDYQISANLFARCRAYPATCGTPRTAEAPVISSRTLVPRRMVTLGATCAIAATAHSIMGLRPVTKRMASSPGRGVRSVMVGGRDRLSR